MTGRFAMLAQADPARAKMLAKLAQTSAEARWELYEQVAGVHRHVPEDAEPDDSSSAAGPVVLPKEEEQ